MVMMSVAYCMRWTGTCTRAAGVLRAAWGAGWPEPLGGGGGGRRAGGQAGSGEAALGCLDAGGRVGAGVRVCEGAVGGLETSDGLTSQSESESRGFGNAHRCARASARCMDTCVHLVCI